MKFLFITDNFFMEQLGIMYISSILKNAGVAVDLIKITEDVHDKIRKYSPHVIGYSVITGSQDKFLKLNYELKRSFEFKSIMGGPHPTFFPQVIEEEGIDYIMRGESEKAILEFISHIKGEKRVEDVHNLSYKINGKVFHNPLCGLIEDLDSLPLPDRELFFKYGEIESCPIKHFIATRGCPFGCAYCFNDKYYEFYKGLGKRVRYRSVRNVISEIKEVIRISQVKLVYFQDDILILDKKWFSEFALIYKKEIALPYHCHVRANLIDEEVVGLLKSSNCFSVHIAIESGNDYLRNSILRRNMKKEEILHACQLLRKHKIKFMLQNMIGLPGGSIKADLETLSLNIKCSPTYSWASIYQPYPGTPLEDYSIKLGLFNGDHASLLENFFDKTILNFNDSYKREIENLQKVFAIIVKYPILYYFMIYKLLLILPRTKTIKKILKKLYLKFRKRADYELYGVML